MIAVVLLALVGVLGAASVGLWASLRGLKRRLDLIESAMWNDRNDGPEGENIARTQAAILAELEALKESHEFMARAIADRLRAG